MAKTRNLYPKFVEFVREALMQLRRRGHQVELAGIFYHVGENDMSWGPFRRGAPERVMALITQSRKDLGTADLKWFVSQQPPTDDKRVNNIVVTAKLKEVLASDKNTVHIKALDLPPQEKKLVLDTNGIVWLGRRIAAQYLNN